ncbi:MAG: hypothetical protein U5Q44_14450 [Dehalococcoidia bacterium]|nr:hypothetical protein [Dehalococcoidia bacterium]
MIALLAILASLSAEALAAWVISTWTAAGFDDASPIGAVSFVTFLVVMHVAYWLPRALETLAVPVRWGYMRARGRWLRGALRGVPCRIWWRPAYLGLRLGHRLRQRARERSRRSRPGGLRGAPPVRHLGSRRLARVR